MKKSGFLDFLTYLLLLVIVILSLWGLFVIAQHFHIPSRFDISMNCAYITGEGNVIDTGSLFARGWINHYPMASDQVIIENLVILGEAVNILPTDNTEITYRDDMGYFHHFYELHGEIVLARVVMDRNQKLFLIDYNDGYILGSVQDEPDYSSILVSIGDLFALKKP